jgi:hypothetical protein
MSQCVQPGCVKEGTNRCSICLREPYCSRDCQKADWKAHKSTCKMLKKFSNELRPYSEVDQIINEILDAPKIIGERKLRVIQHALSYANFQLGERVLGKSHRERDNGDQISNWIAELGILDPNCLRLVDIYLCDESLSMMIKNDMMLRFLKMRVELLMPWYDNISRMTQSSKEEINHVYLLLTTTDTRIAVIYTHRNDFNLAETYCKKALSNAKKFDGEEEQKTINLHDAFSILFIFFYCKITIQMR